MQESNKITANLGGDSLELMPCVEEIQTLIRDMCEKDRLLTAQEGPRMLAVSPDWLYRNARRLPFTRRLGPKMVDPSSI